MQPAGDAHGAMPEGATALEIPSSRPAFYTVYKSSDVSPAANAIRLPPERRTIDFEDDIKLYLTPDPEMEYYERRFAYAYITPADAPFRADPGPFIRLVFRTLALDLPQTFEVRPSSTNGADATVRFRTPDDREAAMRRQPFQLDGATVTLVRDGETNDDVRHATNYYIVHVALHDYPIEQRTEKEIENNCSRFGFLEEVDPACFDAPDLATVHVVLQLDHPREIPHELQIDYADGSTSVVPVEIVRVWNSSHSYDGNGQYVRLFRAPGAVN
jgi:hypothetical protein